VEALGGTAIPSFANFVWVDLQRPAQPVYEALLVQGVIVRPIGGKTMLRIGAGTDEETERFVEAFEHAMKEKVIV
jgi:histidinol-phosphate aminotransferase